MTALPGRLPGDPAKLVLVSGEYPEMAESLERMDFKTIRTAEDHRLPGPVRWHPDMQACIVGGDIVVLRDGSLRSVLAEHGISAEETLRLPGPVYPKDVLCNVLAWDGWVLGNTRTADESILGAAKASGAVWIDVRQGYAACSTALVDERSAITADIGIAGSLERQGIQVLRISPGAVRLPGYPYGFIGGCCGKLAPDVMAFTGRLDSHPDAGRIREFLSKRGVRPVELTDGELLDVGGLIALR